MMNIIIVGGGDLGRHVATILSKENHNITLIDKDPKVLHEISSNLDIAVKQGSGTDWQLLDDLLDLSPDLFIALTGNDETNLVACTIAKQLKYPRTIARIRESRYLNRTRIDFGRVFDVDHFIGPEILAAYDILKYIVSPGSLAVESFAQGALQLRIILIPNTWRGGDIPLKSIDLPENIIVGLIRREVTDRENNKIKKVIFPHGNDFILPGDEVSFIGATEPIGKIHQFFGIVQEPVNSVILIGGSLTALRLAEKLEEQDIDVKIMDKSYEKCCVLAEHLPHSTIIQHDATDIQFLRSERVDQADIVVACTNHDETNLLVAMLSKELGCKETLVMLSNTDYISIANQLGFQQTVSPRISAVNQILSQLFSGKVTSLISLYENQAEIMEISVSLSSKIVGIPLADLGPFLPKDLLIVMIQNRGRIMIAHGSRIISPGDTVIVVTSPKHVDELGKIF